MTVKDKQTAVNVHDSSLYVGETWKAEDNFDSPKIPRRGTNSLPRTGDVSGIKSILLGISLIVIIGVTIINRVGVKRNRK